MAQLTSNAIRSNRDGEFREAPVLTAVTIYEGSAVGLDASTGYARQLVQGDAFLGIAQEVADNSAGASGAINVKVRSRGEIQVPVVGVTAQTDLNANVYVADGNTFTLTSTSNTLIGKITERVSGTTCWVAFDAHKE